MSEAHFDALVIGGSFAGLTAATYIGRALRSVCMIDTGAPRNRFAAHSHGLFGHDGHAPLEMIATARAQVAAYPSVRFMDQAAVTAEGDGELFGVTLADGTRLEARRLVLAYGISDELPEVPGLAERWGRSVIHCPYCHGFEFAGQRLGVLQTMPMSVHQALLVSEWGPVTYFLNGGDMPDDETLAEMEKQNIAIETAPVAGLHGPNGSISEIELGDGRMLGLDALYVGPKSHHNSDIAAQLGCDVQSTDMGDLIVTGVMKATSVSNVFAAGDITRGMHSVTFACADGVMAGSMVHRSLVF